MKLNSQDLEKIADLTLDYYNQHAEDFWEGTRDHDVSQNIAAMLQYIEGEGLSPYSILAADRGETLKSSPNSAISQSVWKAPLSSPPWHALIAAVRSGNRISSSSIYPKTISMAYSPMHPCFIFLVRNCRAFCWNYVRP